MMERLVCANIPRYVRHFNPSAVYPFRIIASRYYSRDDDSKKKSSKDKLNDLLKSIVEETKNKARRSEGSPKVDFKLAVPIREKRTKLKPINPVPENEKKVPGPETNEEPKLSAKIISAVKSVAESLEGDPQTTENELVQKLKTQQTAKINLSELFQGMKIDRTQKPSPERNVELEGSRAQRVRRILSERDQHDFQAGARQMDRYSRPQKQMQQKGYAYAPIDLFGARPLGIFLGKKASPHPDTPSLSTWDRIHEKELKLAATHPPANGLEEMILWTDQEKLWKFPIDNEQGLEESEGKYDFTDHVFLEPHIESWCPKKGPVRYFMELVTVALSKNPYLTVPEKREYLNWYHEYFKGKSHILKEVGAGEVH